MPNIEFKTPNLESELTELMSRNRALYDLVTATSIFSGYEFGKPLVLTQIFRTDDEQKQLYSYLPPDKITKSPHQIWQAVDIRSTNYNPTEINRLLTFLNTFTYQGGQRKVALYHEIPGNAFHFHIQYFK